MFDILIENKLITLMIFILLLLSILCQIIIGVIYQNMINEADNMSATNNKQLKQCKLKFSNCYRMNGGVANISVFVDKFIARIKVFNVTLNSLSKFSSQLVLMSVLFCGIGICKAIIEGETLLRILPYYLISILGLYLYFTISGLVDIQERKKALKTNLIDYLENHMVARLQLNMQEEEKELTKKDKIPIMNTLEDIKLQDTVPLDNRQILRDKYINLVDDKKIEEKVEKKVEEKIEDTMNTINMNEELELLLREFFV